MFASIGINVHFSSVHAGSLNIVSVTGLYRFAAVCMELCHRNVTAFRHFSKLLGWGRGADDARWRRVQWNLEAAACPDFLGRCPAHLEIFSPCAPQRKLTPLTALYDARKASHEECG